MDCLTSLEDIVARCNKTGINCLAIADHGTTDGAKKIQESTSFKIIVAEEILTEFGEIMGMFLTETIPSGLSVEETISRIRKQDGIVCIPHPYDVIRSSALKRHSLMKIIDDVDVIEVFNARNHFPNCNNQAKSLANRFHKLSSAGSDAHIAEEIGNTYVEMPDFITKDDFRSSLSKGVVHGHLSSPLVHLNSTANKIKKYFS